MLEGELLVAEMLLRGTLPQALSIQVALVLGYHSEMLLVVYLVCPYPATTEVNQCLKLR